MKISLEAPRPGWLTITISDNGPGIPEQELQALTEGETPLQHSSKMGLWMIHWITNHAGVDLTIHQTDQTGTTLHLNIPTT